MWENEHNRMTLEVIQLMKLMMEFGFYMSASEFAENMEPLMKLLQSANDVSNEDEENYLKASQQ
jgi:hypothetical protein